MGGLMRDLQAEAYVDPRVVDLNRGNKFVLILYNVY